MDKREVCRVITCYFVTNYYQLIFDHGVEVRAGFWIHVDAALGGTYVNSLRMAHEVGLCILCESSTYTVNIEWQL